MLIFHRQRDNLTEHLQIKFRHSSLILIGGIECVTVAPGVPLYGDMSHHIKDLQNGM